MRASARSSSSPLMPWRSVPKARTARGGSRRGAAPLPPGRSPAAAGRSPATASIAATGSANCSPAAPRTASGNQGSFSPVVSSAAASAAAATRTQAPMLPMLRGCSSRTTGAGRGSASVAASVEAGAAGDRHDAGARRPAAPARPVSPASIRSSLAASWPGQVRCQLGRQAPPARPGSTATASTSSAPKRSACLRAWKPSTTVSSGSRRALRKRWTMLADHRCIMTATAKRASRG